MPRVKPLTEAGRAKERNAKRDDLFRAAIGAWCATHGGRSAMGELSRLTGIPQRTLTGYMQVPDRCSVRNYRAINDALPEGGKIPVEAIGA